MKIESEVAAANSALHAAINGGLTRLGWGDFQIVLQIAHLRQMSVAAKALAMSHVTLLRKLESIETRLKARLFDRQRGHYTPTAAGDELVRAALAMAPLAAAAEMRVLGHDLRPSGMVRITAAGLLVSHLLPEVLKQFTAAFPEVTLEFLATRNHLSLKRREADMALRISDKVPDWLVGRQLALLDFKVYGLRGSPGANAAQQAIETLYGQKRWIGFESHARDLKFDRWLDEHVPAASVVVRVDGFDHALAMVRADLGVALLPQFLERSCPELQPLTGSITELRTPLWLITHHEVHEAMRVRAVQQALGPAVAQVLSAPKPDEGEAPERTGWSRSVT